MLRTLKRMLSGLLQYLGAIVLAIALSLFIIFWLDEWISHRAYAVNQKAYSLLVNFYVFPLLTLTLIALGIMGVTKRRRRQISPDIERAGRQLPMLRRPWVKAPVQYGCAIAFALFVSYSLGIYYLVATNLNGPSNQKLGFVMSNFWFWFPYTTVVFIIMSVLLMRRWRQTHG